MKRQLMFIHGRAQEHKDSVALKAEWVDSFRLGLSKSGLSLPIAESDIRFPYYGDTLFDLVADPATAAAEVILRGAAGDAEQRAFLVAVLEETCRKQDITADQMEAVAKGDVLDRGALNDKWVLALSRALDRYVPGASGLTVALATLDVYRYLKNPGIRDTIENGVSRAVDPNIETVVVSHSLGTVVAYNLLRTIGTSMKWQIPLHVTLGSPLAVTCIRDALMPLRYPACTRAWFNARDPRDIVALYALDSARFPVSPEITNKTDVRNSTPNCHGISGYLQDAEVAKRIHDALVG